MARFDGIATYIMASRKNGTLYTGVTSDIYTRVRQHKAGVFEGFTARCGCKGLVWFDFHADMPAAIAREKQIKHWPRRWKINLIEADNPGWRDLSEDRWDDQLAADGAQWVRARFTGQ